MTGDQRRKHEVATFTEQHVVFSLICKVRNQLRFHLKAIMEKYVIYYKIAALYKCSETPIDQTDIPKAEIFHFTLYLQLLNSFSHRS